MSDIDLKNVEAKPSKVDMLNDTDLDIYGFNVTVDADLVAGSKPVLTAKGFKNDSIAVDVSGLDSLKKKNN